jgi:hypothetical protein
LQDVELTMSRTIITLAIILALAVLLAGGLALAVLVPTWVGVVYGLVALAAVSSAVEALGSVWASIEP